MFRFYESSVFFVIPVCFSITAYKRDAMLSRSLLGLQRLRESALADPVTSWLVLGVGLGGRTVQKVGGVIAVSGVGGCDSRLAKALEAK